MIEVERLTRYFGHKKEVGCVP